MSPPPPTTYPCWLVTRGRSPETQKRPLGLLPLALTTGTLKDARRLATENLRRCALAMTPHDPSGMDILRGITHPWILAAVGDLWVSRVRLAVSVPAAATTADEEAIDWVLLNDRHGRLPEPWQGPADAVIPAAQPVTVRRLDSVAPFEVELTA